MTRFLTALRRAWLVRRQHSLSLQLVSERDELAYLESAMSAWSPDLQSDLVNQRERVEVLEGAVIEVRIALAGLS